MGSRVLSIEYNRLNKERSFKLKQYFCYQKLFCHLDIGDFFELEQTNQMA